MKNELNGREKTQSPVKRPLEQELARHSSELIGRACLVRLHDPIDDALEPLGPLFEARLALERRLEVVLEPSDELRVAAAHPRSLQCTRSSSNQFKRMIAKRVATYLLLDVVKVDAVQIGQHLVDLGRVVQHGPGGLSQVVQRGVAPQGLREGVHRRHLTEKQDRSARRHLTSLRKPSTLTLIMSSGHPFMADRSQFSSPLAKLRMACVRVPGMGRSTSGMSTSTRFW